MWSRYAGFLQLRRRQCCRRPLEAARCTLNEATRDQSSEAVSHMPEIKTNKQRYPLFNSCTLLHHATLIICPRPHPAQLNPTYLTTTHTPIHPLTTLVVTPTQLSPTHRKRHNKDAHPSTRRLAPRHMTRVPPPHTTPHLPTTPHSTHATPRSTSFGPQLGRSTHPGSPNKHHLTFPMAWVITQDIRPNTPTHPQNPTRLPKKKNPHKPSPLPSTALRPPHLTALGQVGQGKGKGRILTSPRFGPITARRQGSACLAGA
jgi:hypothetical protein